MILGHLFTRGESCNEDIHRCLGNTENSVPDHWNEANMAISESNEFFGFRVHTEVMFTQVCNTICLKNNVYTLILKYLKNI